MLDSHVQKPPTHPTKQPPVIASHHTENLIKMAHQDRKQIGVCLGVGGEVERSDEPVGNDRYVHYHDDGNGFTDI